jgi:hypothetical protein
MDRLSQQEVANFQVTQPPQGHIKGTNETAEDYVERVESRLIALERPN